MGDWDTPTHQRQNPNSPPPKKAISYMPANGPNVSYQPFAVFTAFFLLTFHSSSSSSSSSSPSSPASSASAPKTS